LTQVDAGAKRHASRPRTVETEFLPAALEVRDTPPSPVGRAILWTLAGLLAGALAWATASEVDIVAVAPGRIVPGDRCKVVQPLEAGIVRWIGVRDGDRVHEGRPLVALDDEAARADVIRLGHELELARDEAARLRQLAELAANPASAPDALDGVLDEALATRWLAQAGRLATLEAERVRRAAEREAASLLAEKLAALLPFLERRAQDQAPLAERRLVPEQQHRDTQQALLESRRELDVQRQRVAVAEAAVDAAAAQAREARAEFRRAVVEQRQEAERRVAALEQEHVKALARLQARLLTAPADGVVQQLAMHTVGGVVTPAQPLLVVVPDGTGMEVEAAIANRDIGFVAPGQAAEVKLEAFPFTRYGTVRGTVAQVSRDAVTDEKLGLVYKATVRLERDHLGHGEERLALGPGMSATVEVRTGSRPLIDFLLSPLRQRVGEAARER
jgi:hemolysin D